MQEFYVDGIGQVHFSAGMVRFDFVVAQPVGEGQEPLPDKIIRVIVPPAGFLGVYDSMQGFVNKLLEAGVLQRQEPAAPVSAVAESAAAVETAPKEGTGKCGRKSCKKTAKKGK